MTIHKCISIDKEIAERVYKLAVKKHISISALIQEFLQQWYEKNK